MASNNQGKARSRRGIALISVLSVSVILLAMAGAFFAAHKTDLVLMGTSQNLEKTKNAALSASEYFLYKLQNDQRFGSIAFREDLVEHETFPPGSSEPLLEIDLIGEDNDVKKNVIKGEMPSTGLTFEARLVNNLNATSPYGDAPPRTARVWITARRGAVVRRMDFILKRSPIASASMLSGGDIHVQLTNSENGHWWLGGRQPSGNAVRANGTIYGPEVLSPTGRAVLFEPPEGLATKIKPPYGVIQGKRLKMQLDGVSDFLKPGDEELLKAEENIKGVLSPGSSELKIPELDSDDLSSPSTRFELPAGKVSFRTVTTGNKVVHELLEDGRVKARYDGLNRNDRFYTWNDSQSLAVATFDLENRVMSVRENVELQAPRGVSFELAAEDESGASTGNQPTLVLGSEAIGASLKATGINIEGSVGGMGALKAGKGDLKIRAKSTLSTTPDFGIALHSERDVILSKPAQSNQDGIPTDWDAFSKAYKKHSIPGVDNWAQQDDAKKSEIAAQFSSVKLYSPGETNLGSDPIWLSLTKDYPADQAAKKAYLEWMRQEVPEVTREVPLEPGDPGYEPPVDPAPPVDPVDPADPIDPADPSLPVDPADPPPPPPPPKTKTVVDQPYVPPGPGINVENYVRLREYLKTLKANKPDPSWLGSSEPDIQLARRNDVKAMIRNQLSSFQLAAGQTTIENNGHVTLKWNKLGQYFTGQNPFLTGFSPDMKFRGLIYAGGRFSFDTQKQGIELEGALIAGEDMSITNATGARFIYNSELLENLFSTNEGDYSAKLEKAFWAYY